jgi:SAM-dependent methyltransferase/uncharacterized protein YbaR (Trm112 family)
VSIRDRPGLLQSLTACPACGSKPEWSEREARCPSCGQTYAVVDGVPVLVPGGVRPAPAERWNPGALELAPTRARRAATWYRDHLQPESTYRSPGRKRLIPDFVASFPADALVLNVGSGDTDFGPHVMNMDIGRFENVDVVGVAEHLPFDDASCDGVVLQAVLEHVEDAEAVLSECARVLKPGGSILIEVPFMQGYHAAPNDHRRYTEQGLRAAVVAHGFTVDASGVAVGPASAMAWVAAEFLALLLSGRSATGYRLARVATRWLAAPLKYADRWLDGHPMGYTVASGVWVRASLRLP